VLPGEGGNIGGAVFGLGNGASSALALGALARALPDGDWQLQGALEKPEIAALAVALGGYVFTRYGKKPGRRLRLSVPEGVDAGRLGRLAQSVFLTRDLINTPTNDMGPDALEKAARDLAATHGAEVSVTAGDTRSAARPTRRRA
jgi:leucyl aminopeptidase